MPLNTAMILEQAARQSPDRPFLLIPDQRYTYAEVDAEARRFANVLAGLGVKPGEKVALLFPNVPSFVICYYGVLKLGAVCVPLNPLAPGPEIAYLLADSEASAITFVTADMEVPPGSVGLPVWGTTTRLVDEQERDVPAGEPGEIIARGPQFCAGYHNRPEETAETFRNGWFHTGDAGRMDEDGYLFIVDRLKDMIKVSGYAVFPAEVERVLLLHDAVAETAVIGVRHKTLGERVKAFVVLKQDVSVSEGELKAHCKAHLPAYKCPQIVGFSDELPKSPSGKVLRSALREQA